MDTSRKRCYTRALTILPYFIGYLGVIWCHPQCRDHLPPFKPTQPLSFCSKYNFTCCTSEMDLSIRNRHKELHADLGPGDKNTNSECSGYIKHLLCQECSPYAAFQYQIDENNKWRALPGLCKGFCAKFFAKCQNVIRGLISNTLLLSSVTAFCKAMQLEDPDYCYPAVNFKKTTSKMNKTDSKCVCLQEFAKELKKPLLARTPRDGTKRIFVAEQGGLIYIYHHDRKRQKEPFMNISHFVLFSDNPGDERGLLSMTFHPRFKENGQFYLYFNVDRTNKHKVRISEFKVSSTNANKADEKSERTLIEATQPFANHNGGEMLFGTDGYLYAFFGDGGGNGDPKNSAQNSSSLLGKVIRIDVDKHTTEKPYGIPPDNPFVNDTQYRPEIYATGVRNSWRCAMDQGDSKSGEGRGRILCGDTGQNKWEEINVIQKGGNYGWSVKEGFGCYKQDLCKKAGSEGLPNEVLPVHVYSHQKGRAVVGGHVYRGCMNPGLQGLYIYGDFAFGKLFSLHENKSTGFWEDGGITLCPADQCKNGLVGETGDNIMSFGEDEAGELYVVTTKYADTSNPTSGKIYKVVDPQRRSDPSICPQEGDKVTRPTTTKKPVNGSSKIPGSFTVQAISLLILATSKGYFLD